MKRPMMLVAAVLLLAAGAHAQNMIRFGVLGLFHPRTLVLTWTGPEALEISGAGEAIVLDGEAGHQRVVLRASSGRVLVAGRFAVHISACARAGGDGAFELSVPHRFHRVYRGRVEITANGNELLAVVDLDRETAVATIVASEMPGDIPMEALKAQAVVTRSFLSAGPRHEDFDFCDTTHCQYLRSHAEVSARVQSAVRATGGMILNWRERPLAALYSSRCGGRTRSLRQAGIDPGDGYPYYPVECRWCRAHPLRGEAMTLAAENERKAQWGWGALHAVDAEAQSSGSGTARERGVGHGIGMCQYGAAGMAKRGADFRSILAHYYPNAELGIIH
jgi:stage II sporulation protein D